jgi:hypothetical protein
MEKSRQRGICDVKHDYRRKPMVLLAWGLAPDFDVYTGSRAGWLRRATVLFTCFAVAYLVLLAVA